MANEAPRKPLSDVDDRYLIVNIVARRARDLNRRKAQALYDEETFDPLDVAVSEFKNGLLDYEYRSHLIGTGEDFRSK